MEEDERGMLGWSGHRRKKEEERAGKSVGVRLNGGMCMDSGDAEREQSRAEQKGVLVTEEDSVGGFCSVSVKQNQ